MKRTRTELEADNKKLEQLNAELVRVNVSLERECAGIIASLEQRLATLKTDSEQQLKRTSLRNAELHGLLRTIETRRELSDRWRFELETAAREVAAQLEQAYAQPTPDETRTKLADELPRLINKLKLAVSERGAA
jgi:hypothetical protein